MSAPIASCEQSDDYSISRRRDPTRHQAGVKHADPGGAQSVRDNRTKPCQVARWAAELGVSESSLLDAIAMVGHQLRELEFYLRLGKPRRRPGRQSADVMPTTRIAAPLREKVTGLSTVLIVDHELLEDRRKQR